MSLASLVAPAPYDYPEALDGGGFWYPRIDHGYSARCDESDYQGPNAGPNGWSPTTSDTDVSDTGVSDSWSVTDAFLHSWCCECDRQHAPMVECDPDDFESKQSDETTDEVMLAPERRYLPSKMTLLVDSKGELHTAEGTPVALRNRGIPENIVPRTSLALKAHQYILGTYHTDSGTFLVGSDALVIIDE